MGKDANATFKKLLEDGIEANVQGIKKVIMRMMLNYEFVTMNEVKVKYENYIKTILFPDRNSSDIPNEVMYYEEGFYHGFDKLHEEDLIMSNDVKDIHTEILKYQLTWAGRWQAFLLVNLITC